MFASGIFSQMQSELCDRSPENLALHAENKLNYTFHAALNGVLAARSTVWTDRAA